jgi:hypothetical protein
MTIKSPCALLCFPGKYNSKNFILSERVIYGREILFFCLSELSRQSIYAALGKIILLIELEEKARKKD